MRLRQILSESIGIEQLLAPLSKDHKSALRKLIKFKGKPTGPHDILEDRLSELADGKRLAALFLPNNGSTEPHEINESKLPSWCGFRRYGGPGGSIILFKKENEDIIDAMYASVPTQTRHAVRGIVFGYEPDEVIKYSIAEGLSSSWEHLLEDDGWVLSDGSRNTPDGKRGYSSGYSSNSYSGYAYASISVWLSDMDKSDFVAKSLAYGRPHDHYEGSTLIYPGIYMECRDCHVYEDLIRNYVYEHDYDESNRTIIVKSQPCSCDYRMNELHASIILSEQTMNRLNELNMRLSLEGLS